MLKQKTAANQPRTKTIIGIDPGIADTGFGVIKQNGHEFETIKYGAIKTSKDINLAERLLLLEQQLNKIIDLYKPDLMGIEQLFFCNNSKTALIVGQARGVVLLTAAKHKIPTKEFTPLQVKQAVCGYGKADKKQIQQIIKLILKLKEIPTPDDAADALAIAICSASGR